ncbi:hypothetical protein [Streptomyces radiopugnans]|uniref:hypothetical protein n=1 Tax=Streptomyces radiopugnans TaxID=403935 RepID=UPI003F1B14BB
MTRKPLPLPSASTGERREEAAVGRVRRLATGRLGLRPDSPAWAAQVRLIVSRLIAAANNISGDGTIRTIPVPRTIDTAPTPPPATATAAPTEDPAEAREVSTGYRKVRAAYQAAKPERRVGLTIAAARERQTKALLEQRDAAFAHGQAALEQLHDQAHRIATSIAPAGPAPSSVWRPNAPGASTAPFYGSWSAPRDQAHGARSCLVRGEGRSSAA